MPIRSNALVAAFPVAVLIVVGAAGCTSAPPPPPGPPAALWGEMTPVVSVKELMKFTIDPIADNIFNAVGSVTTKEGSVDVAPKTDEDWEKIDIGAVTLAESAYLLKVKRPFAPAGDLNNSAGPDPVELSPDQITAKVEKDPVEWNARIEALRNVSMSVREIVRKRDVNALWDVSEALDQACEQCHRSYWYPGEDAAFYRRLRDRLDEYNNKQPGATVPPSK